MITVVLKTTPRRTAPLPENNDYMMGNWRITSSHAHIWRPPTDVFEREDEIVVRVEIAGMNENDFAITLEQNILTIRGSRQDLNERRAYHQMEINFGEFLTAVEIQVLFETEHIQAEYQNGFLWVILPKSQPKTIKIKENE